MFGLSSITEGFSGKLGEQWLATLFTPALLFWAGGCIAWASRPHLTWGNWEALKRSVLALDSVQQLVLAIIALLLVAASSTIAERFTLPLLRLFEGYWPRWTRRLSDYLAASWERKRRTLDAEWQPLADRAEQKMLSRDELSRYVKLERRLHEIPVDATYLMPTGFGNVLRAAERRPYDNYGLDGVICWPRLWLVMQDSVKNDITDARSRLNASTRLTFWALAFAIWVIWTPFAIVPAVAGALYGYRLMIEDARTYAQLIEAAYDVGHRALYRSLGWFYPANAAVEQERGIALTSYIWRGSDSAALSFRPDD